MNPYVTAIIRGFKVDTSSDSTMKVKGNGFNPHWNRHMEFNIYYPENAVLLFIIYHESDGIKGILSKNATGKKKLAYYSLPVGCIKEGYRWMELLNEDGIKAPMADLLCRFSIERFQIEKAPPIYSTPRSTIRQASRANRASSMSK